MLVLFCSSLATRHPKPLSYKAIKSYLSAIRFYAICKGFDVSFHGMDRLYYVLRGIKRSQGNQFNKTPRSPITKNHLTQLHNFVVLMAIPLHDRRLYWSAFTLAFFGLLRVSEYTCQRIRIFNHHFHLTLHDIKFTADIVHVHIKASKNDPFRVGCTIKIASSFDMFCPVQALRSFLRSRNDVNGPLFTFLDGTYLTRSRLVAVIRSCFNDVNLNTHSFRIGGATALAAAGVSDARIQVLGRWNSNCFVKYIRVLDTDISRLAPLMSNTEVDDTCWSPRFEKLFN